MKKIHLLGIILICFSFVYAGTEVNNAGTSVSKVYAGGDYLQGTLNVSLEEIPLDASFTSNFDHEISVLEFLTLNNYTAGRGYSCFPNNCESRYEKLERLNSIKVIDEKVAGISIEGTQFNSVTGFNLTIQSNSQASCTPNLGILIGDNENTKITNYNYVDEQCFSTKYGCFESTLEAGEYLLSTIPSSQVGFCEKMTLPAGPAFKIGANVKNDGNSRSNLTFSIYPLNSNNGVNCKVAAPVPGQHHSVECIVNFSSQDEGEYAVCVKADPSYSGYKIRTESNDPCGLDELSNPNQNLVDYEIYAKNLKFKGSPAITINRLKFDELHGIDILDYLDSYVANTYSNCDNGCVIPIKIFGNEQQGIMQTVNYNLDFKYIRGSNTVFESDDIFNVSSSSATISSNYLSLDIRKANFKLPLSTSKKTLQLNLDGEEIYEGPINLTGRLTFSVEPRFVPYGQDITLKVVSNFNVSRTIWSFGDGQTSNSPNKETTHKYNREGSFNASVEVTRTDGLKAIQNFTISVGSARDVVNQKIIEYKSRIQSIEGNLTAYPPFVQTQIKNITQLDTRKNQIQLIENSVRSNSSDYTSAANSLLQMDIPISIRSVRQGTSPIFVNEFVINNEYIEQLSDTPTSDDEKLVRDIGAWMENNVDISVYFEEIHAFYDNEEESLSTYFKTQITPKQSVEAYLIMDVPLNQIEFLRNYGQTSIEGGTYLPFSAANTYEFIIEGEIKPEELGMYASPLIEELGIYSGIEACDFDQVCEKDRGENGENCPNDCRPYGTAIILVIALIAMAIAVFFIGKIWYQKYYERSLFKKKIDLFNITTFIKDSKIKGLSKGHIVTKLKHSGWTGEQIDYAFKKVKF